MGNLTLSPGDITPERSQVIDGADPEHFQPLAGIVAVTPFSVLTRMAG